ncbi:MAG: hypothetical protein ABR571_15525 [Jatrophihabitans sp.]|uniref:hypothetical protein n=1 Tax=Jatrophihabitans sp. TaxID=1932789 RepID=UPI003912D872
MDATDGDKYVTVAVGLAVLGSGIWMVAAGAVVALTARVAVARRSARGRRAA